MLEVFLLVIEVNPMWSELSREAYCTDSSEFLRGFPPLWRGVCYGLLDFLVGVDLDEVIVPYVVGEGHLLA